MLKSKIFKLIMLCCLASQVEAQKLKPVSEVKVLNTIKVINQTPTSSGFLIDLKTKPKSWEKESVLETNKRMTQRAGIKSFSRAGGYNQFKIEGDLNAILLLLKEEFNIKSSEVSKFINLKK